jgi:hypothetical protein
LEGRYWYRVIERCGVNSQFTFAYAGPMVEMAIAMVSGEMTAREDDGVQQSLQHAYGC